MAVWSKMEVLVDFGDKPDDCLIAKTITCLECQDSINKVCYKNGSLMIETTLPTETVLDFVKKCSGKRAVLQGFGDCLSAVAMISNQDCEACDNSGACMGVIRFQTACNEGLIVDGTIDGLKPGPHGLHIRESGDLSKGCESLGPHFNPHKTKHGSQDACKENRHAGDLGNVCANDQGRATFRIMDRVLKMEDLIGRSVAVTANQDDLGKGGCPASLIDGNSGPAVACGIIARSAGVGSNPKRICECDGTLVWDAASKPCGKGDQDGGSPCSPKDKKSLCKCKGAQDKCKEGGGCVIL